MNLIKMFNKDNHQGKIIINQEVNRENRPKIETEGERRAARESTDSQEIRIKENHYSRFCPKNTPKI